MMAFIAVVAVTVILLALFSAVAGWRYCEHLQDRFTAVPRLPGVS